MTTEKHPYIASPELMDEVKLSMAVLKPKQEQHFMGAVGLFQQFIIDQYGEYISEEIYTRNKDLNKRIVLTTQSNVEITHDQWDPELESLKFPTYIKTRGFYSPQGHILFLTHPRYYGYQYWNHESQETKDGWIEAMGTEKEARREYGMQYFGNALIHELLHAYEDSGHMLGFSEGGVTYYQQELSKENPLLSFTGSNFAYEGLGKLYGSFVEVYGSKMHQIFFGGQIDQEEKVFIHNQFRTVLEEAFKAANII